jgi:type VI secretion system protein ImpF
MPRTDNEVRITPSVLDRLLDYEPQITTEPIASRHKSLRQLKDSVKRDLEWLLNTRQNADEIPEGLKELHNSLAVYGLPDFSSASVKSPSDQNLMRHSVEEAVRIFEPRLKNITVHLEQSQGTERALHFRIEAFLDIEPAPEPVTFDTVLELHSGEYKVQGD